MPRGKATGHPHPGSRPLLHMHLTGPALVDHQRRANQRNLFDILRVPSVHHECQRQADGFHAGEGHHPCGTHHPKTHRNQERDQRRGRQSHCQLHWRERTRGTQTPQLFGCRRLRSIKPRRFRAPSLGLTQIRHLVEQVRSVGRGHVDSVHPTVRRNRIDAIAQNSLELPDLYQSNNSSRGYWRGLPLRSINFMSSSAMVVFGETRGPGSGARNAWP